LKSSARSSCHLCGSCPSNDRGSTTTALR
jgi:hypothetical protein